MFYLTKFCRVCVRSTGPLIDIESEDSDAIKFIDKLRYIRAKMVISEEEHCRLMCFECVEKLRVSYLFQKQCTKADQILEQFLNEITSECPGHKFANTELKVTVVPIPSVAVKDELLGEVIESDESNCATSNAAEMLGVGSFNYNAAISIRARPKLSACSTTSSKPVRFRRRLKQEASFRISEAYKDRLRRLRRFCPRITKQQRCLLLKSLLTKSDHNSNSQAPFRKSRKYMLYHSRQKNHQIPLNNNSCKIIKTKIVTNTKGGLKDLLGFIKCYDFGYTIDESQIKEQCDGTVLDRLESFSRTFFYNDFQEYRDTILSLANDSESSDDDDMFEPFDEEEDRLLWRECSPNDHYSNVAIKAERDVDENSDSGNDTQVTIKQESREVAGNGDTEPDNDVDLLPSAFVQACYEDQPFKQKINQGFQHFMHQIKTNLSNSDEQLIDPGAIVNRINRISVIPEASTSSLSSLDLLTRLTNSTRLAKNAPKSKQTSKPTRCHLKCRTRGNPFINPQLMQQFQTRTFKCDTCNRSFKSQGYLQSHCTKMGH